METWKCEECNQFYRAFEVKKTIWLVDAPANEKKNVCAACHKKLTREKRIRMEAK